MTQTTARHRRPAGISLVAVVAAGTGVASLWIYHSMWVRTAGAAAALDANEGIATFAWLIGWCLIAGSIVAALVSLVVTMRRFADHRTAWSDCGALALAIICAVTAWGLAAPWGSGPA